MAIAAMPLGALAKFSNTRRLDPSKTPGLRNNIYTPRISDTNKVN